MNSKNILSNTIDALKISADHVMNFYNKNIIYKNKSKYSRDIVSEVDKSSERLILNYLISKYKKHNFILEEGENIENNSDYTWYIDPLDGTVNFSKGIDIFSISIGLKHKKNLFMGAVSLPYQNTIFYTHEGKSFKNGYQIKCSKVENLKDTLNVFVFSSEKYSKKPSQYSLFGKINDNTMGALRIGSTAYALTLMAEGKIDSLVGFKIKTWDLFGGLKLAIDSGCVYELGKIENNIVDYVVVSNKKIFNSLKQIIKNN